MAASANQSALELFRELAGVPDEQADLVKGALLIAQAEYPKLDRSGCRRQLQETERGSW